MDSYVVYTHINKINGKRYIGITKQKPSYRWGKNGCRYEKTNEHFWNAICKYSWDNFEHVIIKSNLTKTEACDLEIQLIKEYKTQDRNFGYNVLSGGEAPKMTEETKDKISKALVGNKNGLNKPCSEEKRKKISDKQKGKTLSEEHRRHLSESKKGVSRPSPSKETRLKISRSHKKKPVYCKETDKIYESIQECARQLNVLATNVCRCCKHKIKYVNGYHIEYYLEKPND